MLYRSFPAAFQKLPRRFPEASRSSQKLPNGFPAAARRFPKLPGSFPGASQKLSEATLLKYGATRLPARFRRAAPFWCRDSFAVAAFLSAAGGCWGFVGDGTLEGLDACREGFLLLGVVIWLLEALGALLGMVPLEGWKLVGTVFFLLDVVVWDTKGVHTKKRQRNKQTIKQTNKRTQPNTQRSNGKKQRPKGGTKHERRSSTKGGRTKRKEEDHL